MSNNTSTYAVITGASRGLGKACALELARRQINVILVSLPGEGLEELAKDIRSRGADAVAYETDLTDKSGLLALTSWLNKTYEISILINNAGIGGNYRFLSARVDMLGKMIDLNVRATTFLTHQLMPNLITQEKSYVLNVSSLAALSPIPYKTIYPASKAFIHSFTRGLQKEFADSSISFSVLNPGPMKTNGEVSELIEDHGFWSKLILLSPEKVAQISIRKMFGGSSVIKLNWAHRLSLVLLNLPVDVKMAILGNISKKGSPIKKGV